MLADLSVPLVGDGADTPGATGADVLLTGACFFWATVAPDPLAPKVRTASEMPERQKKTPSRLRALIKPELEEDCFFIWLFLI
jgi:hypothetical protein